VHKRTKLALWVGGAILFVPVALIVAAGLLLCGDHVASKAYSPSQEYVAQVEESDCGAVSGFDTDVMIRERPIWLSNPHLGRGAQLLHLNGSPSRITIQWNGDHELDVECRGCSEQDSHVFRTRWKGVTIRYASLPAGQK
jgi:hypothetical protein